LDYILSLDVLPMCTLPILLYVDKLSDDVADTISDVADRIPNNVADAVADRIPDRPTDSVAHEENMP